MFGSASLDGWPKNKHTSVFAFHHYLPLLEPHGVMQSMFAVSPQVFPVPGQPWDGLQPVLCNSEATALTAPTIHLFYKRT